MYEKVLDEREVSREVVDTIRALTDAPLDSCIEASRAVFALMEQWVKDDSFNKISKSLRAFSIDEKNCYDSRVIRTIGDRLSQIFKEKKELSFSASQDDVELIQYLQKFADCTMKTDPRIPLTYICLDDFEWMSDLISLYQMDQNDDVHMASLSCIDRIASQCDGVLGFLLESNLPRILAMHMPSSGPLPAIHLLALSLLTKIFSTDKPPLLQHFDNLNTEFFTKLTVLLEHHPAEVLEVMENVNAVIPSDVDNVVVEAFVANPIVLFGEVFCFELNKKCTERRIRLLLNLSECVQEENLIRSLFYSNDLNALSHILARELSDSAQLEVRIACLKAIAVLARLGVKDEMVRDAVLHCDLMDGKEDVLAIL